ncbi:unnamed protein product [Pleuronectes platessa]|uniref:Uncharacterized protein n=1 Tax=Pleuronectes platessa TaxID=8262 RepID=A0A9N7ULL9_PLEPL|nr:unnamed protein product [Pleuronectes platessa]
MEENPESYLGVSGAPPWTGALWDSGRSRQWFRIWGFGQRLASSRVPHAARRTEWRRAGVQRRRFSVKRPRGFSSTRWFMHTATLLPPSTGHALWKIHSPPMTYKWEIHVYSNCSFCQQLASSQLLFDQV